MLFSWQSLAHRYHYIFSSREFPNVGEVIKNRVKLLLKELKETGELQVIHFHQLTINMLDLTFYILIN
jgi:hypothetical protein